MSFLARAEKRFFVQGLLLQETGQGCLLIRIDLRAAVQTQSVFSGENVEVFYKEAQNKAVIRHFVLARLTQKKTNG